MAKAAIERSRRWRLANPEKQYAATQAWRKRHPGYVGPTRQAKVDWVTAYKEATPCADCGQRFPACCMDFDHRESKRNNVGSLVAKSSSLDDIKREISLCDLVCANCHRIRTRDRGHAGWHGKHKKDDAGKGREPVLQVAAQ